MNFLFKYIKGFRGKLRHYPILISIDKPSNTRIPKGGTFGGAPTSTSLSLEAQLASLLIKRRARAKALINLTREALLRALQHAYARRLYMGHVKIGTGELVNLILELELPAPKW
ncbi:MAG TPA: hypothetical protein VGC99_24055 [Candidatus Tectomicrobia bacterium]